MTLPTRPRRSSAPKAPARLLELDDELTVPCHFRRERDTSRTSGRRTELGTPDSVMTHRGAASS